jgi:hypothetical protein
VLIENVPLCARAGLAIPASKATTDVVTKRSRNFGAST